MFFDSCNTAKLKSFTKKYQKINFPQLKMSVDQGKKQQLFKRLRFFPFLTFIKLLG